MTDETLPTDRPTLLPTTRQKIAVEGRSVRNKVTGKLRAALDMMVWEGKRRAEAAAAAGMADSSLRFALRKPHVLSYHRAELAALRTSLQAKNVHRLDTIADTSKNDMAKVHAIKTLEQLHEQDDPTRMPGQPTVPGMVIIIQNGNAATKVIGPTIDGQTVPNSPAMDPRQVEAGN